jgi:hypothetical protein
MARRSSSASMVTTRVGFDMVRQALSKTGR